jgi:hypothetical protein
MKTSIRITFLTLLFFNHFCFCQKSIEHPNAHSHNDYEHEHPLFDALQNGFLSVEADVHLHDGKLLVAHNRSTDHSPSLEQLYFKPLDSLMKINNGFIYATEKKTFMLMIDIKTKGEEPYKELKKLLSKYEKLKCNSSNCPVKIFLSGERPIDTMIKEGYAGMGIDGRPDDVEKGYSAQMMPVISDTYKNWSTWNGQSPLEEKDLQRIRELAQRIHSEGKKFRLWAIPDNELGWQALLDAGVDLINTDHLQQLNVFLTSRGK